MDATDATTDPSPPSRSDLSWTPSGQATSAKVRSPAEAPAGAAAPVPVPDPVPVPVPVPDGVGPPEQPPEPDPPGPEHRLEPFPLKPLRPNLLVRTVQGLTVGQIVTGMLTMFGVLTAMTFVWLQMQPRLLLRDTLTAGGDMGAHVWGPAYLRRELLPNLTLSGWTPDWYAGFPAYKFYMVLPALLVVAVDQVPWVSYNVAFKLVTVSGLVTMPLAAWFMGRMFRLRFPGPALLAFATLPFLFDFDERFRIIGGNVASTLAGEFSFSISLTLCLVYLGIVARGLETGRHRAWGALLFALVLLNHLIPGMFAVVATILLGLWRLTLDSRHASSVVAVGGFALSLPLAGWAGYTSRVSVPVALALPLLALAVLLAVAATYEPAWRATMWWVAPAGLVGGLLSAFWSVPFLANRDLFNDMGWERLQTYRDYLGPAKTLTIVWYAVFALGIVAVVLSIVERQLIGVFLASSAVTMGLLFAAWPDTQMWNARFLPFYYLSLYLLAGVGLTLFIHSLPGLGLRSVGGVVGAAGLLFAAALPMGVVPGSKVVGGQESFYGVFDAPPNFVDDWARWNYRGYQGKDNWPEYQAVVDTMDRLGRERGCGRAMWEYQTEKLNSYGTPMALMLLPYWTKGCIGSMEGLYFESSATTPYHFLNQSELSHAPSRAQRDLPYSSLDVDLGVQHLQLMGVKYYMALTVQAKDQAARNEDLTEIATSGPWTIYEVADAELVEALDNQPAVLTDVGPHQNEWLAPSAEFYNDPERWNVLLASEGPPTWERVSIHTTPQPRATSQATVSAIVQGNNSITFEVDRPGVPVLVKTSYFPNWKVKGGDGPYRVMPNLMVVVPTSNQVRLHFERSGTDWGGLALTAAGVVALFALAILRPPTVRRPIRPRAISSASELDLSRYRLDFVEDVEPGPEAEPPQPPEVPSGARSPTTAQSEQAAWGPPPD